MKVQLASGRPVSIATLTMITAGMMPATNGNPIQLIWTWVKSLIRRG
jgi:hypothetical protein